MNLRSPESSGFLIRNISGIGPVKGIINTTEALSIDGVYYNSARVSLRNIVLDLVLDDRVGIPIETLRQQLYRYFPVKKLVVLEISTTNRTAYTNGYVELVDPNIFSKQEAVQISIICPNAFFSSDIVLEEDLGISESLFEFPFENPSLTLKLIEFGRVGTNLTYSGDEPTGFLLTCTFSGSASDPIFVNFSTGELMSLTYDFIAGDILTISSVRGNKFISLYRSGSTVNLLGYLDSGSSWLTIAPGQNALVFDSSDQTLMSVSINSQTLFQGV